MMKFYLKALLSILFICKTSAQTANIGEIGILPETEFATVGDFNNHISGDIINDGKFIIYSNYNNDGLFTFSSKEFSGLTYFKGSNSAQIISGSELTEFNNVRFENGMIQPAFLLSGTIIIYGICDFREGIISNNNLGGTFIFKADAISNNPNNNSYVDGYVERMGSNEFKFPVGYDGFFRPLAFSQNKASENSFVNKYVLKNSDELYPHSRKEELITLIDSKEYWELKSNKSNVDIVLTLTWDSNTTPDEFTISDSDHSLAIVKWDNSKMRWKFYTSAVNMQEKTITAVVDGEGIFTIGKVFDESTDEINIYNAISPNGDGLNDYFKITGLEKYSDALMQIYNRYGVKVYESLNYGINGNWFRGKSDARATLKRNDGLPTGTYFYVLKYKTLKGNYKDKAGYLYINND